MFGFSAAARAVTAAGSSSSSSPSVIWCSVDGAIVGVTGWVRIQSTGGAPRTTVISILVCEENLRLAAVRGVCCMYQ